MVTTHNQLHISGTSLHHQFFCNNTFSRLGSFNSIKTKVMLFLLIIFHGLPPLQLFTFDHNFFICGCTLNNFYLNSFNKAKEMPRLFRVIFIVKSCFQIFWQLCSLSWNCSQIFTTFLWMNIIDVKVVKLIQNTLRIYTQLNSKEIYILFPFMRSRTSNNIE